MKTIVACLMVALCLTGALLLVMSSESRAAQRSECPNRQLGETEADCPWASVVRTLEGMGELNHSKTDSKLKELQPKFHSRIQQESKVARDALPLWGTSLNYDEGAQATIIQPAIIDYLLKAFGASAREDRVVHAGVEHTYGYLLSNLQTPFGFKRARWVRDDLEAGFALKRGTLGPNAVDGGFLSNVTYFAGAIAFRGEKENLEKLDQLSAVSPGVKKFEYQKLNITRLEERFTVGDRTLVLRTDFVPFTGRTGANAEALIYSVKDFRGSEVETGPRRTGRAPHGTEARLVTMFPVAASFRNGALDPTRLGEKKPIQTRYNAFISGITGQTFEGTRTVTTSR